MGILSSPYTIVSNLEIYQNQITIIGVSLGKDKYSLLKRKTISKLYEYIKTILEVKKGRGGWALYIRLIQLYPTWNLLK